VVLVSLCGRFVAVLVCGRFGLWPFWTSFSITIIVCRLQTIHCTMTIILHFVLKCPHLGLTSVIIAMLCWCQKMLPMTQMSYSQCDRTQLSYCIMKLLMLQTYGFQFQIADLNSVDYRIGRSLTYDRNCYNGFCCKFLSLANSKKIFIVDQYLTPHITYLIYTDNQNKNGLFDGLRCTFCQMLDIDQSLLKLKSEHLGAQCNT